MAAIEKQLRRYQYICNAFINYNKLGVALRTKGACMAHLERLKSTWEDFECLHEILEDDKGIDKKDPYFVKDIYSKANEAYAVAFGQFQDCILEDRASISQHSNQSQALQCMTTSVVNYLK